MSISFSCSVREAMAGAVFTGDVIQLGPGRDPGVISGVATGDMRFSRVCFEPNALVRTAQSPAHVQFTVPICGADRWCINGLRLPASSFLINSGNDESESVAEKRTSLCGRLPADVFRRELRMLGGDGMADTLAPTVVFRLSASENQTLVQTLSWIMMQAEQGTDGDTIQRHLVKTLAIAVSLSSDKMRVASPNGRTRSAALFRQARDIYADRAPGSLSMGELCHEMGISAPTLGAVFQEVTGQSPARFFALQRLARSHEELGASTGATSAVKRAALGQGFRDLGRFGRYYRSIYGVLPSEVAHAPA